MSEFLGKTIVCDRCGKTHFLRYKKTDSFNGGYTNIDQFESMPEGWEQHYAIPGLLCEECEKEYADILKKFMNRESSNNVIIRHAYFETLEPPLPSEIDRIRKHLMSFHLRGYHDDLPGIDVTNSIDAMLLINSDDIPENFKVGKKIKITLEVEDS